MKFVELITIIISLMVLCSVISKRTLSSQVLKTTKRSSLYTMLSEQHQTTFHKNGEDGVPVSSFFGTNLKVQCLPGTVLNSFRLQGTDYGVKDSFGLPDKIQYQFRCVKNAAIKTKVISHTTELTITGMTSTTLGIKELELHNVKCPGGYGIQSFYLAEKNKKMQYVYTCIEVKADVCRSMRTKKHHNSFYPYDGINLAQIPVNSPNKDSDFLQQFQFQYFNNSLWYKITACSFNWVVPKITPYKGINNVDYENTVNKSYKN